MPLQSSLQLVALLSCIPFTFASYAYPALTAGVLYSGDGWTPTCFSGPGACFDGCSAMFAFADLTTAQSFTYTFAVPSTTWEWWGFYYSGSGSAQVCWDGATTGCDTVNYSDPSSSFGGDPTVLLYSKTGLSNAVHTVTVTNLADDSGQFGVLNVDHMVIDGGLPQFPSDTVIGSIPLSLYPGDTPNYNVDLNYGAGPEPLHGASRVIRTFFPLLTVPLSSPL